MDKYIIVTTLCDNEIIANNIVDTLLHKKLISSSQIWKVHSKYWWNNKIEETDEFKIELRTKLSLFKKIEQEIKKIHNYDVAEISYKEISGNIEFLNWIDEEIKT